MNLSWTLVGLVIATLTLTGSAQQITGLNTIITLGIWLLTIDLEMICGFKHPNGYTNVSIVHCKYGGEGNEPQVIRTQFGKDATNGMLFIDGQFECYTLEDQYQAVK